MIFHPVNVSSPVQLGLQQHGLNADDLCLFKDLNYGDKVAPVYVKDCAEAVLVEQFEESQVVLVSDP